MAGKTSDSSDAAGEQIIRDYGALIDRLKLSPQEIRDESELPHPKQQIMDALLAAYSLSGRGHDSPARLQGWLLTLAQFQPGVGEPIGDIAAETARRMSAKGGGVESEDLDRLAQAGADDSADDAWAIRRASFQGKVDRDRNRLIERLQRVR